MNPLLESTINRRGEAFVLRLRITAAQVIGHPLVTDELVNGMNALLAMHGIPTLEVVKHKREEKIQPLGFKELLEDFTKREIQRPEYSISQKIQLNKMREAAGLEAVPFESQ